MILTWGKHMYVTGNNGQINGISHILSDTKINKNDGDQGMNHGLERMDVIQQGMGLNFQRMSSKADNYSMMTEDSRDLMHT